ncbi:hypothetical protein VTN31DRAFT_6449 [Thermomyces dupontii]|uniref:uncharacterized protein n=1 Tax=Talaromyces thermophilus TaxID=28565 RepID=UPI0037449CD9
MIVLRSINALRSLTTPRIPSRISSVLFFHSSRPWRTLKEDNRNMDAAQLHEEYDAYKRENLRAVKEGRGKWSEELASNSESAIKADRDESDLSEVVERQTRELKEKTVRESTKKSSG